jgi:hypothetical protein
MEQVADALSVEFARFAGEQKISTAWRAYQYLDAAFRSAPVFANVVSHIVALPTNSRWVVLWNNSFLCSGYDALCFCLSSNHRLTTVHWSAHDDRTTFQSGASFTHRRHDGAQVVERSVASAQEDKRWIFHASGSPLPEEDTDAYAMGEKRERLNEQRLIDLLERLGATPWSEAFYALPARPAFVLSRPLPPKAVTRPFNEIMYRNRQR